LSVSGWICSIQRSDRGDRLVSVRLLGVGCDELWVAPAEATPVGAAQDAAVWLRERLGKGGSLRMLCADVDGAACSWLTVPDADPRVVLAAMRHSEDDGWDAPGESPDPLGAWQAAATGEADAQALAPTRTAPAITLLPQRGSKGALPQRLSVIAMRDAVVKVCLDALDDQRVGVGLVTSIWHALATAWDAGGPAGRDATHASGDGGHDIAAMDSPATAVVLLDPLGRLVWSWSQSGNLLAAGSIRLYASELGGGATSLHVSRQDVARLATDWLSWTAQLGMAPRRVLCLTPETDPGELDPAGLARALSEAMPDASVDLATMPDPVGATLARLVDLPPSVLPRPSEPRSSLVALSHRRGRAHKALYRWSSLALIAMAVGSGGWRSSSGTTRPTRGCSRRSSTKRPTRDPARRSGRTRVITRGAR
jgi:hypothetical protein